MLDLTATPDDPQYVVETYVMAARILAARDPEYDALTMAWNVDPDRRMKYVDAAWRDGLIPPAALVAGLPTVWDASWALGDPAFLPLWDAAWKANGHRPVVAPVMDGDGLPPGTRRLTIFRAQNEDDPVGIDWSLSEEGEVFRAESFAAIVRPAILSSRVGRRQVRAVLGNRVIVPPPDHLWGYHWAPTPASDS